MMSDGNVKISKYNSWKQLNWRVGHASMRMWVKLLKKFRWLLVWFPYFYGFSFQRWNDIINVSKVRNLSNILSGRLRFNITVREISSMPNFDTLHLNLLLCLTTLNNTGVNCVMESMQFWLPGLPVLY